MTLVIIAIVLFIVFSNVVDYLVVDNSKSTFQVVVPLTQYEEAEAYLNEMDWLTVQVELFVSQENPFENQVREIWGSSWILNVPSEEMECLFVEGPPPVRVLPELPTFEEIDFMMELEESGFRPVVKLKHDIYMAS